MGLMDFIKGELIEIIQWNEDARDVLSWRFPDEDKEIKNGAQLVVRESQVAQFVYLGQFGDIFNPGTYSLTTENIPVLTTLGGGSTASNRHSRRMFITSAPGSLPVTRGARRTPSCCGIRISESCGCALMAGTISGSPTSGSFSVK